MNKYTKNYTVILDDMDMQKHRLRPISAVMYLQDTFARYCATQQMAAYDLQLKDQIWVVGEINMDFVDDLPFWSEDIKVELWFSEISKLKVYADFCLYHRDKLVANGNSLWLILNAITKRPVKTEEMSTKFEICPEFALGEHTKMILPTLTEPYTKITHVNNLSDTDFNKHVNNKSYINLAEMTAPAEFKQSHTLKSLHVRFNRETFLGDTLCCTAYKTTLPDTYAHVIEKDGISVCDIVTTWKEQKEYSRIVDYDLDVKQEK